LRPTGRRTVGRVNKKTLSLSFASPFQNGFVYRAPDGISLEIVH
jgi:hypothetical protein